MPDEMLHLPMVNSLLERHKRAPGALLPILHEIQEGIGYIPDAAIPEIAHALNLSQAEVRGVISFYHDFRTCLLYTSPSPRDGLLSRMPSSA